MKLLYLLLLVLLIKGSKSSYIKDVISKHEEFGYAPHNGPATWAEKFKTCNGGYQSPINLDEDECLGDAFLPPLRWRGTNVPRDIEMHNTWHSVEVTYLDLEDRPTLTGGPLRGDYVLSQVHFHWGSEHSVKNRRYNMEIHMVHYNAKYKSIQEASKKPNGLVVVALFLKGSEQNNTEIEPIVELLPKVREGGNKINLPDDALTWLWDCLDTSEYFTYKGSLTTPPCSEGITWIVLKRPSNIGHSQVRQFQWLLGQDGPIGENRRPVQLRNAREVIFHFTDKADFVVFPEY